MIREEFGEMIGNATDPTWKCGIDLDCVLKAVPIDVDETGEYTTITQGISFADKNGQERYFIEVDPDQSFVESLIQLLVAEHTPLEQVEETVIEYIDIHYITGK